MISTFPHAQGFRKTARNYRIDIMDGPNMTNLGAWGLKRCLSKTRAGDREPRKVDVQLALKVTVR